MNILDQIKDAQEEMKRWPDWLKNMHVPCLTCGDTKIVRLWDRVRPCHCSEKFE